MRLDRLAQAARLEAVGLVGGERRRQDHAHRAVESGAEIVPRGLAFAGEELAAIDFEAIQRSCFRVGHRPGVIVVPALDHQCQGEVGEVAVLEALRRTIEQQGGAGASEQALERRMLDDALAQAQQEQFVLEAIVQALGETGRADVALSELSARDPGRDMAKRWSDPAKPVAGCVDNRLVCDFRGGERGCQPGRLQTVRIVDLKPCQQARQAGRRTWIARPAGEHSRQQLRRAVDPAELLLDDRQVERQVEIAAVERHCLGESRRGGFKVADLGKAQGGFRAILLRAVGLRCFCHSRSIA